jgi:hypothetical protein
MNPWKGLKGLPHDMWALFFTSLINRSGTMVIPFLALYLTKKIGVSPQKQEQHCLFTELPHLLLHR